MKTVRNFFHYCPLALVLIAGISAAAGADGPKTVDVFVSGQDGFNTYRIPSVVVTKSGAVLAFAEARKTRTDQSENKIVLKRSTDGGVTWGAMQIIADAGKSSLNNPCAVVEQQTGHVLLMYQCYPAGVHEFNRANATGCKEPNVVRSFLITSDDDGKIWLGPRDVTCAVKSDYATTIASGPGIGIQLTRGNHEGRLIMPFNEGPPGKWNVYAAFSDDRGATWQMGARAPGAQVVNDKGNTNSLVNEVQMVELADGSVMLNSRSGAGHRLRKVAVSADGGVTWSKIEDDAALREPRCMASVLRYSFDKSILLFSNPDASDRNHGTIRASFDEGKTWPVKKVLDPGKFAYSCLTRLPDGKIGCLYEAGTKDAYERIVFAQFPLAWVTGKE
jgi:sialidase-1